MSQWDSQHEAFGERKNLGAWTRDPRCPISAWSLHYRVNICGLTVEQAFALGRLSSPPPAGRSKKFGPKPMQVTAWGETKTLAEWAADPRAKVPATLIANRLYSGFKPEQAISMPKNRHRPKRPRQPEPQSRPKPARPRRAKGASGLPTPQALHPAGGC